jgi:cytochrome c biogenesis protein CcmG/thiol:disulfide interchange protein DsbE
MSDDHELGAAPSASPSRRGRMAPFIALAVALVCAGLFFVLAGAESDDKESADSPLLGRPAPEAFGELENGTPFDLARRKGSWVVLNFFDSNCVPCVQEHPDLLGFDESQQALGSGGAELVTVVYGDDPDGVREFFEDNGGEWPVVYDADGSISAAFGVNLVPETWVIDPDGVIQWRTISMVTTDGLNQVVDSLRTMRG